MGLGAWITAPAWGARPPSGDDVMALAVRTDFGVHDLLAHWRLDGWSPRFLVGYQHFLFYGPGLMFAVTVVRLLTLNQLSTLGAIKVIGIVCYVALGPAVAFMASGLGLGRRAAGASGILALAVNSPFGVGLAATYTIALLPQALATLFVCVAVGSILRAVVRPEQRWILLAGLSTAAVLVTHPLSVLMVGLVVALAVPCLAVTDRPNPRNIAASAGAVLAGAGLAGFWTVPYLVHYAEHGQAPAWATPALGQRIADIVQGHILFSSAFASVVLLSWTYAAVRISQRKRWAVAVMLVPPAFFVIAHTLASRRPHFEVSPQLANRGLGVIGLLLVLPLGALIAAASHRFRTGEGMAVAASVMLVLGLGGSLRHLPAQMKEAAPDMHRVASLLRSTVPPQARFATERDFPGEIATTGVSHPDFWLAEKSRRNTLNVFGAELTRWGGVDATIEAVHHKTPEESADALSRLGVTELVTVKPETATKLTASPRYVSMWADQHLAVLRVVPRQDEPAPASLMATAAPTATPFRALVLHAANEHLRVRVTSAAPANVTAAIGWSSQWRLHVNGRPQPVGHTVDGLLTFKVPRGRSVIRLDYAPDAAALLGMAVSLGSAGALLVWLTRRRVQP